MAQPNLDEIKEVSALLDKIEQYKILVENSKIQLEDTKRYYSTQEIIEKQKIQDHIIQRKLLDQLQQKITEYRTDEVRQKIDNYNQFSTIFDTYIQSNIFKSLIGESLKYFNSSTIMIVVGGDLKSLVPVGIKTVDGSDGQLRVCDDQKEYILDPKFLKKITFDRLIVSDYSNTL